MKKILFFVMLLSSVITNSQTIGGGSGGGTVVIDDGSITDVKIAPGINKSKVGLGNVENTSDVNKPISKAAQTELDLKVDKVTGKSLLLDNEITRLGTLVNYTHPATHPPSIIAQDSNNRFVTDAEKNTWNNSQSSLASISTKTSSYTLTSSDATVLFDTTAGNLTATLPDAAALKGKIFSIRKSDLRYNTLSFSPPLKSYGSDVTVLNYQLTIRVQSDGNNWIIIE